MTAVLAALVLAAAPPVAPGPLAAPVVVRKGTGPNGYPRFEITNPNDRPLPFLGYRPDSYQGGLPDGVVSPM